jgi:excisionase family DNA binding protein
VDQPETATRPAYRVREIAVLLSVDVSTVYRWIEKGSLTAYRFEDSIRVAPEDFDAFKRGSVIRPARNPSGHCCAPAAELDEAVA